MIVNKKSIFHFRILSDIFLINLSIFLSAIISHSFEQLHGGINLVYLQVILNLSWIFTSKSTKLYDDFRSRDFSYELIIIIKNVLLQFIIGVIFLFLVKEHIFNRLFIFLYSLTILSIIILKSYLFRRLLSYFRKRGRNVRRLLIVGTEYTGMKFKEFISKNGHLVYKSVGFVDDEPGLCVNGEYLGKINEIEDLIHKKEVDDVVVTLPDYRGEKIGEIVKLCAREAIRIRIVPDYSKYFTRQFSLSSIGIFPVITLGEGPLEEVQWRLVKRLFDLIFSSIVIILVFSWFFPVIYIMQKIFSPGSLFFTQERIGKNGKVFNCYKIRTMRPNGIKDEGEYKPTINGDSRVTTFGKLLRKTNIDELPQFFNVFMGDMSIVGPRPHALSFNGKYSEFVEEIKSRHRVKPGITGWAQIKGLRGDVDDEKVNRLRTKARIDHDVWYIENWSFWLDIQIIFLTVWRMFKGDPNAY